MLAFTGLRELLGGLHRVYYVPVAEHADGEHDPDRYNRGIAPSVKLLHAVVARLVDIDISTAVGFVRRWELINSPIHLRLWAALSRDARITPANEVSVMLLSLDDWRFWDITHYPEIAELRAKRFSEFAPSEQAKLTSRIRKSPPRNQWPKKADPRQIKNARQYWTVLELRRIEIAGACLPRRDKVWLDTRINNFPELVQMVRLDYGFVKLPEADIIGPNPDNRFDLLDGKRRLEELEAALSATRSGWYDEPAPRAAAWIWQPGNSLKLLVDLVSINDGGTNFARVWDLFGRAHSPRVGQDEDAAQRDLPMESARVLSLLVKLPEATIRQAVDGISQWLCVWGQQLILMPEGQSVWLKLWPIAVEVTNATQPAAEKETYLNTVMEASDDRETMETDTLNSPVGKFVSVFLAACPNLQENAQPFDGDGALRRMRDAIIASTGFSKLIAQYRMIECLPYFLNAAPDWTHEHLIAPLTADNSEAIALWRAIARRTQFSDVLKIIGDQMAERATDPRLSRETRRSLVFSLVIECLHAFNEQREPAMPYARTQQMIRSLDDEVRAHAAAVVRRFVRDISASSEEGQTSPPENIFRTAALPFLQQVWPQERSLATPGVSRSLAALPATARGAFAEAVDTIERFLVPFECWAMSDYGFSSEAGGNSGLSIVNNPEKAAALLRLLDLTIGTDEGAMIPYDLAEALNQICRVAPNLAENQVFRRLSTVARRG
jgi:hypothetical protein